MTLAPRVVTAVKTMGTGFVALWLADGLTCSQK